MDLFEQIDQFEKMANELADQLEEGLAQDSETVEETQPNKLERRQAAKARYQKLASFQKR
jgi:regulator of replication initiation timing